MRGTLAVILVVAGGLAFTATAAACPRQNDGLCDEPFFAGATGICPMNSDTADCADREVWWGSDETAIDPAELFALEPGRPRLARNEIFARHGRKFQSAELQGFFALRSWYQPADGEPALSAVEKGNVALFKAEEDGAAAGQPHASGMPRPLASFSAEVLFDDGTRLAVEQVAGRERQFETSAEGARRERLILGDRREIWDLLRADGQATVYSPWYDPRVLLRLPALLVSLDPVLEGTETLLGESASRFRLDWKDPEGAFWDGLVWVSADGIVLKADVRFRAYEGDALYDGAVRFELVNLRREALEPVVPPSDLAVGFAG